MSKTKKAVTEVVVNQENSKALNSKLSEAIAERVEWSAGEELSSNNRLYGILAQCYAIYDEYLSSKTKQQWKADFYDAISTFELSQKTYEGQNKLTLTIVRVVFGDSEICRRRVSTYAKVLRTAAENGGKERVKVADLAQWIGEQGGVQEVARETKADVDAKTRKREFVQKRLTTMGRVEKIDAVKSVDLVGNYMLMLVRVDDEDLAIQHVYQEEKFIQSAIGRLYSSYKGKEKAQVKDEGTANTVVTTVNVAQVEQASELAQLNSLFANPDLANLLQLIKNTGLLDRAEQPQPSNLSDVLALAA